MTRFLLILLALVTLLGCQEPFLGDGEDDMRQTSQGGGWSASGPLVALDTDINVHLQVDFPDSGPYTLQFSLELPSTIAGPIVTIAEIDWKVEGNWVHRTVNVRSGTSVSGTAEAVKVRIRDDSKVFIGEQYTVSVQVAKGTRPAVQQPPTYQPEQGGTGIVAGASTIFLVPQNSGVIAVWLSVIDDNAVPIMPAAGSVVASIGSTFFTSNYVDLTKPVWTPIPPGTTQIQVFNAGGANVTVAAPIYGIDG